MLSSWSGPAETLTKYNQACGVKGEFLETQVSCRERSRSDATDPVRAAAQDLFVGGLSHCLSHRFLPWKKEALAQRAVSCRVTQRWAEHSALGREAPSPAAKTSFPAEPGGQGSLECWGHPAPMQDPPEHQTPSGESTQRGPERAFVTAGQWPGEGPARTIRAPQRSPHGCLG